MRRDSPVRERKSLVSIVVAILGMTTACIAVDADPSGDALERSFYPYATEKPVISALAPGSVLSKETTGRAALIALNAELMMRVPTDGRRMASSGDPAFSPANERVRVPVWLGDSVINHTSGQAAVSVLSRVVFPPSVPKDVFEVARLLERGRLER
jgi:hypothetical protein